MHIFSGERAPLISHLALQHSKYYTVCHKMQVQALQRGYLLKKSAKSPIWIWFAYRANRYGRPQDKEVATCLLCQKDCASPGSKSSDEVFC